MCDLISDVVKIYEYDGILNGESWWRDVISRNNGDPKRE